MSTTAPRVSEYDRFGPWIDEVVTPDDVPRLFRDHPLDLAAARLVLKVPRNIARRDATPDMDLYDHLLVLDDAGLTVLTRRGAGAAARRGVAPGGYDAATVRAAEMVAIRDVVNILDGHLSVHSHDGAVLSVRYNGSGRANVERLVTGLRDAASRQPAGAVGAALRAAAQAEAGRLGPLDPGRDDLALASDFRDLARENRALTAWTCHGRVALAPSSGGVAGLARRALLGVSPMTLHGAILAGDDVALEVLGRHDWLVRGRAPVHSSSRLVLPLRAPERVDVVAHPDYAGVAVVRVAAGAAMLELAVPEGSAAHRVFAAAAGTGTASTPPGAFAPMHGG